MEQRKFLMRDDARALEDIGRYESLYSIGNGNIGARGYHLDRSVVHHSALYMNGLYETSAIRYPEDAYGLARVNQTMVELPDVRQFTIFIGSQRVSVDTCVAGTYQRELDFTSGLFSYRYHWEGSSGLEADVSVEALISMHRTCLGGVRISVRCNGSNRITIHHEVGYDTTDNEESTDPRKQTAHVQPLELVSSSFFTDGNHASFGFRTGFRTQQSTIAVTASTFDTFDSENLTSSPQRDSRDYPHLVYTFQGSEVTCSSLFAYMSEKEEGARVPDETIEKNENLLRTLSFDDLLQEQREHYRAFWDVHTVEIEGAEDLNEAMLLNIFQLHQSVGTDGRSSLSAKGMTGSGYEGHYFWDTEIYGMPFFTLTSPYTARSLISYRIRILQKARDRAREMNQKGALFPWRTINGLEASSYFPAGTAQYHINADIAYSIFSYLDITGDDSILEEGALELLFETARFYADLGFFNEAEGGAFCINQVTGPDEYSALVDNNTYTNAMASYHLERSAGLYGELATHSPDMLNRVCEAIALNVDEVKIWKRAAQEMRLPYDEQLGIYAQDERFLSREKWDVKKRGEILHPMLLHYHPLVIYRHQVIKQADTILSMFLLPDRFASYDVKRSYDYYHPLTTGDSSLSACIEGIVAFSCGYESSGYQYAVQTILMDRKDLHHNTQDGLHTAAMGGAWMAIVYGMAGLRLIDGIPKFRPLLPAGIRRIGFNLLIQGSLLKVDISPETTRYQYDGNLVLYHRSERLQVNAEGVEVSSKPSLKAVVFDLDGVITSTDEYHYRAWDRLCKEQGWHFDHALNDQLRGVSRTDSLKIIARDNRVDLTEEQVSVMSDTKNRWYRESLGDLSSHDVLPGILRFLAELKEQGIATAVASASRNASYIISKLSLDSWFDYIVPAAEVIRGKPDPEVFLRAAQALSLFPEECLGIEDAPPGIQAIRSGGMSSVGIGDAIDPSQCDVVFRTTAEISFDRCLELFG
ncbi:MAG: beta-phosphoglucomutase [Sphaerochaetaceae bacterium]|nr:beta-phosphoglucomutase [Sphaerochaetaceae bacterium]